MVYEKLGFIKLEKQGYFNGSRSFFPIIEGRSMVMIQLMQRSLTGSFNSTALGNLNTGNLEISFPANAFEKNGQLYTGLVNVYARALDPSVKSFFDQMPGELLGTLNNEIQILRSFGMAAIEITDNNNEPIQLRNGNAATLRFNIPEIILTEAPDQIEFWSFDEHIGYWKFENIAIKEGHQYTSQAEHFSWWNYDVPLNIISTIELKGIIHDNDGNPISSSRVEIITETFGTNVRYSNQEGEFRILVPSNQNLTVNLQLICNTTLEWVTVFSENVNTSSNNIDKMFSGSLENRYPINGKLLDCEGIPVEIGYVKLAGGVFFANNGEFTIPLCTTGNYSFQGFDTKNDSIRVSEIISLTVNNEGAEAGDIMVCSDLFGIVTDIDGNIYSTIRVGNQVWMAENLKTTRYADSTIIVNYTANGSWDNNPANGTWCSYENNQSYDAIFGKLYNWYAASNSRNVCPINWHLPSDDEWKELEINLGMTPSNANHYSMRGDYNNVGGQMKTTGYWQTPNVMANNTSGFSALPGGIRRANGEFEDILKQGNWWTSTFSNYGTFRKLSYSHSGIERYDIHSGTGMSVRCVKD